MLSFITNKKHNQRKEKNANTKTMKWKRISLTQTKLNPYILPPIHRLQSSPIQNAMYGRRTMAEAKRRREKITQKEEEENTRHTGM
jgi:hypothetical protein